MTPITLVVILMSILTVMCMSLIFSKPNYRVVKANGKYYPMVRTRNVWYYIKEYNHNVKTSVLCVDNVSFESIQEAEMFISDYRSNNGDVSVVKEMH